MKNILPLLLLLAACGPDKLKRPAVITSTTKWKQVHGIDKIDSLRAGDTVELAVAKPRKNDEEVLVRLRTGQRGFVQMTAISIPDSLLEQRTPQQIVDELTK